MEIARKLKFRHTRVENMSIHSQIVDWEVQSLFTPSLTADDSMIHQLIYIHATMCEPTLSSLPSCEEQGLILPLHLSHFISPFIPWLEISLVFCINLSFLGKHEQLFEWTDVFLYAVSSTEVKCCVSELILPPGFYFNFYLLSVKVRAKSWQVNSAMISLVKFLWVGYLLLIMVPFDLCTWLTKVSSTKDIMINLCWQNVDVNCKAEVNRY